MNSNIEELKNLLKTEKLTTHKIDIWQGNFSNTDFTDIYIKNSRMNYTVWDDSILDESVLSQNEFIGAKFINCSLKNVNLSSCNLLAANFGNADLSNASLYSSNLKAAIFKNANLTNTDLCECIGNRREIKNIFVGKSLITYTSTRLYMDFHSYLIEEWKNFSDDDLDMLCINTEEWKKWKPIIFQIIEMSPATPTGHE